MRLSEIESRYILSCHPYEGRRFSELAEKYKSELRNGKREISEKDFARAFPHAYKIYKSGRDLKEYFESTNQGSHNWLLWMFIVNSFKRKLPENILIDIITHVEYCSVKVGKLDDKDDKIFFPSLTGEYFLEKHKINFLCKPDEEYYMLHGFDNGKVHAIRQATIEDFNRFKEWFNKSTLYLSSSYLSQLLY